MNHHKDCCWHRDWTMCNCDKLKDMLDLDQKFDHQATPNTFKIEPWYSCAYCEAGYPDQGCTCGEKT